MYIDGLHKALREAGLGVHVFGRLVPLLMYADDLVLLARTAEEMEAMHRVVDQYARQWRFDINNGKTKIVVAGSVGIVRDKAAVRARRWFLCSKEILVADEYKYLGAEFGMARGKWNTLLHRVWEKARDTLNVLMWQGGGAGGLRPRSFVTLWEAKCRPQLEYACPIWEGDNVNREWDSKFEALQITFGKAVLRLKGNVAGAGVLSELGLDRLKPRRQQLKLGYWEHLCTADNSRLLSLVFRNRHAEVVAGRGLHSCLQSFRDVLVDHGFGDEWESKELQDNWKDAVLQATKSKQVAMEKAAWAGRSSLEVYASLGHSAAAGVAPYLDDWTNREGVRMLTKCRLGYLLLMKTIARILRWPLSGGCCVMCDTGEVEDTSHFLQRCPALNVCRRRLEFEIQCLGTEGEVGAALLAQFAAGGNEQLRLLLGAGEAPVTDDQQGAKAMWVLDKACKNYISACWKLREALVGDLRVEHGRIFSESSKREVSELWRSQGLRLARTSAENGTGFDRREMWEAWIRRPSKERTAVHRRGRSAFFTVWKGRRTGVFVGWDECVEQVANVQGAKFKGFDKFQEAVDALAAGADAFLGT